MSYVNPTQEKFPKNLTNVLGFQHRNGAYPLDDTQVWDSEVQLEAYLTETNTYAYPGQLVSVANGGAYDSENDKDVSLFVVRPNGTKQPIGLRHIFDSVEAAEAYVKANPEVAIEGVTLTSLNEDGDSYELHVVKPDGTLGRVSFDVSDIPDVTWEALQDKPNSTVEEIDAAVEFAQKFNAGENLTYTNGDKTRTVAFTDDIPNEVDASTITGIIDIKNLPKAATNENVFITDEEERLTLTAEDVQNGDMVTVVTPADEFELVADEAGLLALETIEDGALYKNAETGTFYEVVDAAQVGTMDAFEEATDVVEEATVLKMYFVNDDTKLGTEDAFMQFAAGHAATVDWSGVQNKPTTVAGSGLTDAISTSMLKSTFVASAPVKFKDSVDEDGVELDAKAKSAMTADVAEDAELLGGEAPEYYGKAEDIATLNTSVESLQSGAGITELDGSKITGAVDVSVIPEDARGKVVEVGSITAMHALTTADVYKGDIVKVLNSNGEGDDGIVVMYQVVNTANLANDAGYEALAANTAKTAKYAEGVDWDNIDNVPELALKDDASDTYVAGGTVKYVGAVDPESGVEITAKVSEAAQADNATNADDAGKLNGQDASYYATTQSVEDANAKIETLEQDVDDLAVKAGELSTSLDDLKAGGLDSLDVSKLVGANGATIALDLIPAAALEILVHVADEEALLALTATEVQNGDSVQIDETKIMYRVTDDTKLGTVDAFTEYAAGIAARVNWSGIVGMPDAISDIDTTISDAIKATQATKGGVENAGKVVTLNAEGMLDVQITGEVAWSQLTEAPTVSVDDIDSIVNMVLTSGEAGAEFDKFGETEDGALTYKGSEIATADDVTEALDSLTINIVANGELPEDAKSGQMFFEELILDEVVSNPSSKSYVYTGDEIVPDWETNTMS